MIKKIFDTFLCLVFPPRKAERSWHNKRPDQLSLTLPTAFYEQSSQVTALFDYKNVIVKDIVWSLKYDGSTEAAKLCAVLLYDVIVHELTELHAFNSIRKPILLPIPISREREKKRGFNQCMRIANELEKLDNNIYFTLSRETLKKHKDTPSQTRSENKQARAENLRGCFSVSEPNKVRGKDIILLDDVFTTGSTLAEATATLKHAGARNVFCFTFAH